jgi:hypothetical protein
MSDIWEFGDAPDTPPAGADATADTAEPGDGYREDRPADPATSAAFPWPPPEHHPILPAFAATWRGATLDPARFFRGVPSDGGTGAAFGYFLVLAVLVAGVGLFWETLGTFAGASTGDALAAQLGAEALDPLVGFLLTPGMLAFGLLVSAAVTHVLLLIVRGATHGFGTTFRAFCYAYSPAVFVVVPLLGAIVGSIWMVVLLVIGLREAHATDGWKAAMAVLLPVFLATMLMVLAVLLIVAAGAALMTGGVG